MNWAGTIARHHRDLTLIDLDAEKTLVVACDSAGAIGPKPLDVVQVSGYVLGRFTARVALMEVVAAGAWPICVVNTLCVEPDPSGTEISLGVADEIRVLGLQPDDILTGSTEKNVPTRQSALGVTVMGIAPKDGLKIGGLQGGDSVVLIGVPKVGAEVVLGDEEIIDLPSLHNLVQKNYVKELVPVGSRGVLAEVQELAHLYNLEFDLTCAKSTVDLSKSAGPSTCLIAVGNLEPLINTCNLLCKPWTVLGKLR